MGPIAPPKPADTRILIAEELLTPTPTNGGNLFSRWLNVKKKTKGKAIWRGCHLLDGLFQTLDASCDMLHFMDVVGKCDFLAFKAAEARS